MVRGMQISIIIPVYNVKEYLSECVNSVLHQTYQDLEILLVDDGSTDLSSILCDEYVIKDNRISVIHKTNAGLSSSRNTGMAVMKGEYTCFVDSDDFLKNLETIERYVKRIKISQVDVLNYTFRYFYEDTKEEVPYPSHYRCETIDHNTEDQMKALTKNHLFLASACTKMVKTRVLTENNIYFRDNILSEDVEWCAKLMKYAKSYDFISDSSYCYRQRTGSITHSVTEKTCSDLVINIQNCIMIANSCEKSIRESIFRFVAYTYGTFFVTQAYARQSPKKIINEMAAFSWLLKYECGDKRIRVLYHLVNLFGYSAVCKMIRLLFLPRRLSLYARK